MSCARRSRISAPGALDSLTTVTALLVVRPCSKDSFSNAKGFIAVVWDKNCS